MLDRALGTLIPVSLAAACLALMSGWLYLLAHGAVWIFSAL